jgi:hypothetical protein
MSTSASVDGDWFYLLRQYDMSGPKNPGLIDAYLREAFIPAVKRLGLGPVGVFSGWFGRQSLGGRTVIIAGADLALLADLDHRLAADEAYATQARAFAGAPVDQPPFTRLSSSLLRAMPGLARLETPADLAGVPGRLVELRTYEQPTLASHDRKVEMFVEGEAALLDASGLRGIMYGVDIVGERQPRLTYLWIYADLAERQAAEAAFFAQPTTREFFGLPRYAGLQNAIANDILRPTEYSDI